MKRYTQQEACEKWPDVTLYGPCYIHPGATIGAGAVIGSGVSIYSGAIIGAGATIGSGAAIRSRVTICPGVTICSDAVIGAGRKNVTRACHINGMNEWGVTGFLCDDGLIITIGCMNNCRGLPPDEALDKIYAKYGPQHIYSSMIMLIEEWAEGVLKGRKRPW